MAQIIANDEKQEVTLPLTLAELIKINKVFQPEMVTIQVNEDFAEKEDYEKIQLKDGDRVDFLYFMGGGACQIRQYEHKLIHKVTFFLKKKDIKYNKWLIG